MSNRSEHLTVGMIAGTAAAMLRAPNAPANDALAEILGGLIGGYIGGVTPDLLEPATSSYHRGLAHSLTAGGMLGFARIAEWEAKCRDNAARCVSAQGSMAPIDPNAQLNALLWRVAAGLAVGFVAGYASHLALDAGTPRSIPLLAR